MYIVAKSKIESRAHYAPEPTRGTMISWQPNIPPEMTYSIAESSAEY